MLDIVDFEFIKIDHEKVNKKNKSIIYQNYIDKHQYNEYGNAKQSETIRIVKGYLEDYKIALLVTRKLDKTILQKMIKEIEPNARLEKIEKQWLRYNVNVNINDNNINEGIFEWYIQLKELINQNDQYVDMSLISTVRHIGAGTDENISKKLLFINIIVDGKLYDKVYFDELNEDIIHAYAKRYQFTLKNYNIMDIKNNNIIFQN